MKISGFTIIKNAVINDYPIVEAIRSILPCVDEMIVLIGDCDDDTLGLIQSINNDKIKVHHSVWDKSLIAGGAVLADETNKAFDLIDPSSDWAFYIQADEVVPDTYHQEIIDKCQLYKDDKRVEGLLFKYLHFYGTYDYIGDSRRWYNYEVRIIKNDKSISSYRDAQGFRKGKNKLNVKEINAVVHHYGWVKDPVIMNRKKFNIGQYWEPKDEQAPADPFDYSEIDSIALYEGEHPEVMNERIARKNWQVQLDPHKKKLSLKKRLLWWYEKRTGKRLLSFRNYSILKN